MKRAHASGGIQMRYCGDVGIRVRYDDWDAEYHCRILLGGRKVGEEHVHPPEGKFATGAALVDAVARKAVAHALRDGLVGHDDVALEASSAPHISRTPPSRRGRT